MKCRALLTTSHVPGAIAIIQLCGDVEETLRAISGHNQWPIGAMKLVDVGEIDPSLVARITGDFAQVMPHGGPRVVQRMMQHLHSIGLTIDQPNEIHPRDVYPEAADDFEAVTLAALARAASPLAIDLLLLQPQRWRQMHEVTDEVRQRSHRLNRLIEPANIVLVGPANVGKSTLSNALVGRSMSIAADQPGTTRDYVAGRINLNGVVVNWYDTPGVRDTVDAIEREAQQIASRLLHDVDVLIAMTDHEHLWPTLPREPDLRIANKSDIAERADADVCISATTGTNLDLLVSTIRQTLVPHEDLRHSGIWVFDSLLEECLTHATC